MTTLSVFAVRLLSALVVLLGIALVSVTLFLAFGGK